MNTVPALQARGISTTRGDRLLFNSLWLELEPGQAVQIHGPNGSGKTTLLRILCTLTPPDSGSVHWHGKDVLADRGGYLRELAYVGHAHGIKDELTALENLRIGRRLGQPAPDIGLRDALSRTGLGELAHEPARHFSAGQRRRLALARLLVTEATLWILDEPFTALDREGVQLIEQLIAWHLQRGGMTVMTSHQPLQLLQGRVDTLNLAA